MPPYALPPPWPWALDGASLACCAGLSWQLCRYPLAVWRDPVRRWCTVGLVLANALWATVL